MAAARRCFCGVLLCRWLFCLSMMAQAGDPTSLRLIPFPKDARLEPGVFPLTQRLVIELSQEQAAFLSDQVGSELKRVGINPPVIRVLEKPNLVLRLSPASGQPLDALTPREGATSEDYVLRIRPDGVTINGAGPAGLFYGVVTLCQLIRANRQGESLPCLTIRDWPSLRWRAFQDDLTRGPSSSLQELQREAALGAVFKLNIFTYYMEYQFAFAKHPVIGPADGSLTPEELRSLVEHAAPFHLNILGNQQSFGHFTAILAHPEYVALRETPYLLCPTNEKTYQLLDDLYSEVTPLLPFPFFNVCCDETDGLGQGPSKALAGEIGAGALYVRHIRRLHDLIRNKYQKRMMMWGDIILRHPGNLQEIPKDTVMLTWAYDPRANFENQIIPFAKSGFEFFVCPGVNCWNRVLPDFGAASVNIRNFVRDGVKHGAIGMLNTAWDDDGESFNAPNWQGFAWGAECAWNASATSPQDFHRRLGGVLFGETRNHFGPAIELLSTAGISGLPNSGFWKVELGPIKAKSLAEAQAPWQRILEKVRAAIEGLEACQKEATANADLLDYFLFGARRMAVYAQRELARIEAAVAYRQACRSSPKEAPPFIAKAEAALRQARDSHEALRQRFAELWLRENKPYALDWTLRRYDQVLRQYDALLERLAYARSTARVGHLLPTPADVSLDLVGRKERK